MFVALRRALEPTAEQLAMAQDTMSGNGEDLGVVDDSPPVAGAANQAAKAYHIMPQGKVWDRAINWGRWFSWLLWQPFRAAGSSKLLGTVGTLVGWVVIALLIVTIIPATAQKQWL